jgi:hypothetical protein
MSDFQAEDVATEETGADSGDATTLNDDVLDTLSGGLGNQPIAEYMPARD